MTINTEVAGEGGTTPLPKMPPTVFRVTITLAGGVAAVSELFESRDAARAWRDADPDYIEGADALIEQIEA